MSAPLERPVVRGVIAAVGSAALVLAAAAVARPAIVGQLAPWWVVGLGAVLAFVDAASNPRTEVGAYPWAHATTGVALLVLFVIAAITADAIGPARLVIGTAIGLCGVALRGASGRALGGGFVSDVAASSPRGLVTTGPYAVVRHPSELGIAAVAGAACVVAGGLLCALWCVAVLIPSVVLRVRREDAALRITFGPAYVRYAAASRMLVPGLW